MRAESLLSAVCQILAETQELMNVARSQSVWLEQLQLQSTLTHNLTQVAIPASFTKGSPRSTKQTWDCF